MQIGGTTTDREILHRMVLPESICYYGFVFLVLSELDFFLVKPDVETGIRLLKTIYIKIVYYCCPIKIFEGIKKLGLIPFAGVSPFWLFSCRQTKPNNQCAKIVILADSRSMVR